MPNPKLETYKNKATNTVYDLTDADAQGKLTAILDGTTIDSFGDVETALADKVDKVTGKGLSTNDYDDTEKAKVAGAFPRSEQAVLGAVNIAPMSLAELKALNTSGTWSNNAYTLNGNTITVNTDTNGNVISLVANGAPSATVPFFVTDNLTNTDSIRLVGCPSGGSSLTYKLCIVNTSGSIIDDIEEIGNGKNIQMSQTFRVQLRVYSGATIPTGGLVFKPMLTYNLSATYADFAPYAMTNRELTEKVTPVSGTITSDFTYVPSESFLYKVGKLVTASIRINDISSATAWSTVIGTIPEGFRPRGTDPIRLLGYTSGTLILASVSGYDGKIYVSTNITNGNVIFVGTWVTD